VGAVLNGGLSAFWTVVESTLEAAREQLDEREFNALSLGIARNLGLTERSSRGRPPAIIPADKVAEVLEMRSANGHLSEREIARRIGISRRQVKSILRRA
jgi:AraC-like DNA-binding protein